MTETIPRSGWTSSGRGGAQLTGSGLEGIAWHWPGTSVSVIGKETRAQVANRLRGYRNFHVGTNGWSDIGYNDAIDQAGRIWDLRGLGRVGAHAASSSNPDANREWVGVLLILGADEEPSAEMIEACRFFTHEVFLQRWPGRTGETGHGRAPGVDGAQTSCPGPHAAELIVDGELTQQPSGEDDMTPEQFIDLLENPRVADALYKAVFRNDGFADSPYGKESNPTWWVESHIEHISKALLKRNLSDAIWQFNNDDEGWGVAAPPSYVEDNPENSMWWGQRYQQEIWEMLAIVVTLLREGDDSQILEKLNQVLTTTSQAEQQRQEISERLDSVVEALEGSDPAEAKLSAIAQILNTD